MSRDYHNEHDPFAAQWLRNLIAEGLLPPGDVDERSIVDVRPSDLAGYTRCHFFSGIGGWPFALRLAGWPDGRPVWTGSCPCQPWSIAGKRRGADDERHLWPVFGRLIEVGRPPVVFGEQVARAPDWLRLVRGDLVQMGYAMGAIPLEAASADADHFRDRYWFVADLPGDRGGESKPDQINGARQPPNLAHRAGGADRALVDRPSFGWGEGWTEHEFRSRGFTAAVASIDGCQYLECPDGKWRRLPPPGVRWLGTRIPARVAKLRAFGNAIDPRPAAEFIRAYLECRSDHQ